MIFLSTPSARRATGRGRGFHGGHLISIHALREEGDSAVGGGSDELGHFYPRPPRGGRRPRSSWALQMGIFLSTPSARRATSALWAMTSWHRYFYPRPPRGGRPRKTVRPSRTCYFYPRPPRGGRLQLDEVDALVLQISIHALREEGDASHGRCWRWTSTFLSTPSARRATCRSRRP